jgi:YHS domain-containing protein
MVKQKLIVAMLSLTVVVYSCSSGGGSRHMSSSSSAIDISPDLLAQITDPVCGMDMTQTKIADTATVDGKLYAFCNSGCKEEFVANPSQYLK